MKKEIEIKPINGVVEPDFLQYIKETFKRWKGINKESVKLGSREIVTFKNVCLGAKMNARFGFEYECRRETDEEKQEYFVMLIYKNKEAMKTQKPLYTFSVEIHN